MFSGKSNKDERFLALINKMTPSPHRDQTFDEDGNRVMGAINTSFLHNISSRTAGVVSDLDSMLQVLPDIHLAREILTSSVLSPKDLSAPELQFDISDPEVPRDVAEAVLKVIREYFVDTYNIDDELQTVLTKALVNEGAYIRMIVPESSIDDLINKPDITMQDITQLSHNGSSGDLALPTWGQIHTPDDFKDTSINMLSMGHLSMLAADGSWGGNAYQAINDYTKVTDNPNVVKLPKLVDAMATQKRTRILNAHTPNLLSVSEKVKAERKRREDKADAGTKLKENRGKSKVAKLGKMSDQVLISKLEEARPNIQMPVQEIKPKHETKKTMRGHPMISTLPIEAVIPAFVPGNPKEHIAYFVLLDQGGYPLSIASAEDHYNEMKRSFNRTQSSDGLSSAMKDLRGLLGVQENSRVDDITQATDIYADIVERNLLKRLRVGTGNASAVLAKPTHVYQIMLARAMAKQGTQVLYVPAELMSYICFDHTNSGVGRSLLENTRILGGIRVLMMFSDAVSGVRNSTPRTELAVEHDPRNPDPLSTSAMIRDAFVASRSNNFPLGEGRPDAILGYINAAGVDVVQNGHPKLPQMKVTSQDRATNRTTTDHQLDERFRDRHLMSFGLSPETVDASKNINFATSVVQSSLMLSKRVIVYQKIFCSAYDDYIRKYINNSEILMARMFDALEDVKSDYEGTEIEVLEKALRGIKTSLPSPDTVTLESQMESYEKRSRALDQIMDSWISDDFGLMDAEGDLAGMLRELRAAWKANELRKFLRRNNIMPELLETTAKDDDGKLLFNFKDDHGEHMDTIYSVLESYIKEAKANSEKRRYNMEKQEKELREKYEQKEREDDEARRAKQGAENSSDGYGGTPSGYGEDEDNNVGDGFGGDTTDDNNSNNFDMDDLDADGNVEGETDGQADNDNNDGDAENTSEETPQAEGGETEEAGDSTEGAQDSDTESEPDSTEEVPEGAGDSDERPADDEDDSEADDDRTQEEQADTESEETPEESEDAGEESSADEGASEGDGDQATSAGYSEDDDDGTLYDFNVNDVDGDNDVDEDDEVVVESQDKEPETEKDSDEGKDDKDDKDDGEEETDADAVNGEEEKDSDEDAKKKKDDEDD